MLHGKICDTMHVNTDDIGNHHVAIMAAFDVAV